MTLTWSLTLPSKVSRLNPSESGCSAFEPPSYFVSEKYMRGCFSADLIEPSLQRRVSHR